MDSIGEIAFGYGIHSLEDRDVPFAQAFDLANRVSEFRYFNPLWKVFRWILPSEREMRQSMKIINDFAYEVIQKKRQSNGAEDSPSDVLSRFMKLRDGQGQPFSDEYLRDVVLNFIIAGRDTTAVNLSWTTYALCVHPEIQEQARAEVMRVCQDASPDYDLVKQMPYLQAVVDESTRMYPPVPFDMKMVINADVLPSGYGVQPNVRYNLLLRCLFVSSRPELEHCGLCPMDHESK